MLPVEISSGYDSSILVRRWLGAWIDFAVLCGILACPVWLLGDELRRMTGHVWLGLAVLYFPVLEGLTGRTVGKLVAGTKVVDILGNAPGVQRAAVRTVTRLVEVNPLVAGGLPAGLLVALTKTRQRWGDFLAGTFVLKTRDLQRLGHTSDPDDTARRDEELEEP